ncbi:MAG: O-antigen ligase family protein [bacterium]
MTRLFIILFFLSVFFSAGAGIVSIKSIEILIFSVLCVFLYNSFRQKQIVFKKTNFDLSIFFLFIFSTLNYLLNFNSFFAREEWIKIVSLIVLYYLLVNFIKTENEAEKFIDIFLLFAFIESIFAVGKRFYLGEVRLTGTFASPNFLMGFLLPLFIFIPDKVSACFRKKKNTRSGFISYETTSKIFYYLLLSTFIFISLIYSQSRAGLLLLFLIILIWVYEKFSFSKWFFVIFGIFAAAMFFTPNMKRFLDIGNQDILSYYRISVWESSIQMIKDNFWTGAGLGNFKNSYMAFRLPVEGTISRYGRFAQFAHNEFLELGAEIGFIGIIIGLMFLVKYIVSLKEKRDNKLALNIYKASGLIIFQSFFDYNLHHPGIALLFVFLLASQESLTSKKEKIIALPSAYLSYVLLIPVAMFMFFIASPVFSFYQTKLGFFNLQKRDMKSAAKHFEKAIKWTPDIAPVYSYLAGILPSDAESLYRKAIYFERDNSVFYVKLASFYYNNYPENSNLYLASAMMEKSFIYDPYNAFYPFYLAKCYLSSLKFNEAERYFLESVRLEPNFLGARIYLGFIYGKENKIEKIKENFAEIARIEKLKDLGSTDYERRLVNWDKEDEILLEKVGAK